MNENVYLAVDTDRYRSQGLLVAEGDDNAEDDQRWRVASSTAG
jgi:hypothetical protein